MKYKLNKRKSVWKKGEGSMFPIRHVLLIVMTVASLHYTAL